MSGIEKFLDGFRAFRCGDYQPRRDVYRHLAEQGQSPKVMVIACADSRVDPVSLTQAAPGDLFIIRNVANLVPPYEAGGLTQSTGAALEYAVTILKVEHIVVLGHAHCGGIGHMMGPPGDNGDDFITAWTETARPAVTRTLQSHAGAGTAEKRLACELAGIENSITNLMTFPWIAERVEAGRLALHGWHFDIGHGQLRVRDASDGQFRPLIEDID